MKTVVIHTDGGCHGNPGPGAWAAVLVFGKHRREISGGEAATTNNRMEIQAAISSLSLLTEPCAVILHTDSKYLQDGITKWVAGWKRNGWKTKSKAPVKNVDLWRRLDELVQIHKVNWRWVKGHAGEEGNERCDTLAQDAIAKIKQTSSPSQLREALEKFRSTQDAPGAVDAFL